MSATIDATADEIPATDEPATPALPPQAATSTAVARRERRSEVIRPLNADELAESFSDYQALLPKLLDGSDYQDAGRGKRFVKKSGWRKIATAFDLDVILVADEVERDEDGQPLRAKVVARAIAPSGRMMDGDGYCSVDEDRFSGPRGNKSKLENDLRTTATTRAKNRAISDLVGMGEVSAEEVDGGPGHAAAPVEASDALKQTVRAACAFLLDHDDAATEVWMDCINGYFSGHMPAAAGQAITLLAKAVKTHREAQAAA